jgi:hypothetical protein
MAVGTDSCNRTFATSKDEYLDRAPWHLISLPDMRKMVPGALTQCQESLHARRPASIRLAQRESAWRLMENHATSAGAKFCTPRHMVSLSTTGNVP